MPSPKSRAPTRELDEFEETVYMYFDRMDWENKNEHWGVDADRCNLRFEYAAKTPTPRVSYLLTVSPDLCNFFGNLHGGCAATLVDILSTTILLGMSRPGQFQMGGVSRNLKTTYLRPVPQGVEIRIVTELVHTGRRLALLRTEIFRVDNGQLCIVGEHEKANTDPETSQKI